MTIDASLFAPGLLLLMFPADRLLSSFVQLRSFDCFHTLENTRHGRGWWWVPALWLDPIRGFGGTLLIKTSLLSPPTQWASAPQLEYAFIIVALCFGVLAQMFTRRDRSVLLAPIGFVVGITAALMPWTVAAIGLTAALTGMFAFRHFQAFFSVGLVAVAFLGFVLGASFLWLAPALAVLAVPVAAGALTGRTLEIPTRGASASAGAA